MFVYNSNINSPKKMVTQNPIIIQGPNAMAVFLEALLTFINNTLYIADKKYVMKNIIGMNQRLKTPRVRPNIRASLTSPNPSPFPPVSKKIRKKIRDKSIIPNNADHNSVLYSMCEVTINSRDMIKVGYTILLGNSIVSQSMKAKAMVLPATNISSIIIRELKDINMSTKSTPVSSSTNGYLKEILLLQLLHFPFSNNHDSKGMLCQGFILLLQLVHRLGVSRLSFAGTLYMRTFKKEPIISPNTKTRKIIIQYFYFL